MMSNCVHYTVLCLHHIVYYVTCTAEFSAKTIEKLLLENRYVLHHWGAPKMVLNDIQIKALISALMNRFQLIQGPPGNACEHLPLVVSECSEIDANFHRYWKEHHRCPHCLCLCPSESREETQRSRSWWASGANSSVRPIWPAPTEMCSLLWTIQSFCGRCSG